MFFIGGSPRFIVNTTTGSIVGRTDFDEYGNVTSSYDSLGLPFGFAGGLYDPTTKLVRFGAREYDAEIGRWTSKDPIGFRGNSANLFSYASQNPISITDPNGLMSQDFLLNSLIPGMVGAAIGTGQAAIRGDGGVGGYLVGAIGGFVAGASGGLTGDGQITMAFAGMFAGVLGNESAQIYDCYQRKDFSKFDWVSLGISGGIGFIGGYSGYGARENNFPILSTLFNAANTGLADWFITNLRASQKVLEQNNMINVPY